LFFAQVLLFEISENFEERNIYALTSWL
jgi:hypothetical protein